MQRLILFLLVVGFYGTSIGQSVDQKKMDKDLKVAEKVIQSIIKQNTVNRFFYSDNKMVNGQYKNGYGVVFSVKKDVHYSYPTIISDYDGAAQVQEAEHGAAHRAIGLVGQASLLKSDEDSSKENPLITSFKEYLRDYASLIRQLKNDEKVLLKTTRNSNGVVVWARDNQFSRRVQSISVEASKSDIDAYAGESINAEEFESRLVISESGHEAKKEPTLEVFSSMIGSLYSSDLSETYYMTSEPWYDRTQSMGVTYYIKVVSSIQADNGYNLPTLDKWVDSKEERNTIIDDMYESFLKSMKENIIEYGLSLIHI